VFVHEMGHTFGTLADEYEEGYSAAQCLAAKEEANEANVSKDSSGAKWSHWQHLDHIGAYEGAYYCKQSWYRPTENSMMHNFEGPFYEVNSEEIILQLLYHAKLWTERTPSETYVVDTKTYSVNTVNIDSVNVAWYVDGSFQKYGKEFSLGDRSSSVVTIKAVIILKTPMVRKDDNKLQEQEVMWKNNIGCDNVNRSGKKLDACGVCGGNGQSCAMARPARRMKLTIDRDDEWVEAKSADGKKYWWNRKTRKSTWDPPAGHSGGSRASASQVSCGAHHANNCAECPQGKGAAWCNGDCKWNSGSCVPKVAISAEILEFF